MEEIQRSTPLGRKLSAAPTCMTGRNPCRRIFSCRAYKAAGPHCNFCPLFSNALFYSELSIRSKICKIWSVMFYCDQVQQPFGVSHPCCSLVHLSLYAFPEANLIIESEQLARKRPSCMRGTTRNFQHVSPFSLGSVGPTCQTR
jgi:hypothetical protein